MVILDPVTKTKTTDPTRLDQGWLSPKGVLYITGSHRATAIEMLPEAKADRNFSHQEYLERNGWVRIAITRIEDERDIFITSKSIISQSQRKFIQRYIEEHDHRFNGSWSVCPLFPGGDEMVDPSWEEEDYDFSRYESISIIRALLVEGRKKKFENIPKPEDLKELMREVSLGKDKDGYFVYTHRCRSKSYETPHDIPKTRIKFVGSTG